MSTKSNIQTLLLFILILTSFLWLLKALALPAYPDFTGYYYGAKHILSGENPYTLDKNYFTAQSYPPFTLILFIPFALLPYLIAAKFWVFLSIIGLIYVIYSISKIYNLSFFSHPVILLIAFTFLSFPLKFTLGMGQINILVLLLLTLSVYFFRYKRYYYSGFFLALSVMVKFFPLLLLLVFIIRKKWGVLKAFIITIIVMAAITMLITPSASIQYYQQILPNLLSSWKGDYYNQALTGLLMRNIADSGSREALRIIIPLILLSTNFLVLLKNRVQTWRGINLEIASLVTLNVLINNFSWQHHYVFLILPFFIITFTIQRLPNHKFLYIPLTISYILVSTNLKNPALFPSLIQSHVFFGGLILWILSLYILHKYKL